MEKKYPDVEFGKMNQLTFTTTYKGNKEYDLKIKVGQTEIPCSFRQWAEPWKYGSNLSLKPHFKDLGKKAYISISGGIQHKLFQFFRYDWGYVRNMKTKSAKKKGGGKKTFKSEKKKEFKDYYSCVKKARKNKRNTLKCNTKRGQTLKRLKKKYPKEWSQYQIDFQTNPKLRY